MKAIWDELVYLTKKYQSLNLENALEFEKFNLFSNVHHSTSIEGSTLTEGETEILLEKGLTANGKPLEHSLMVKECYQALLFIIDESKKRTLISTEFLQKLNSIVMKNTGSLNKHILGEFDTSKGEYRLSAAFAQGGGYYLSPEKIPAAMDDLCDGVNKKIMLVNNNEERYKLSFDVHYNLVSIHPWGDGNGRTSRLAMNYIQLYFNLPLTKVYLNDRIDYIESLKQTRLSEDINIFRNFMAKQQIRFLNEKIAEYENYNRKSSGTSLLF
jgi:Fic family protein